MSRKCPITGKKPLSGNLRSHSMRATKRKQNVNIQRFTINENGKKKKVKMSVRGYKIIKKRLAKKNNNNVKNNSNKVNNK